MVPRDVFFNLNGTEGTSAVDFDGFVSSPYDQGTPGFNPDEFSSIRDPRGKLDWELVSKTTLTADSKRIDSGSLPARTHLLALVNVTGVSASCLTSLQFNKTGGSSYTFRLFADYALSQNSVSTVGVSLSSANSRAQIFSVNITNEPGYIHGVSWQGSGLAADASDTTVVYSGAAAWHERETINQISIWNDVDTTFNLGSSLTIYATKT